MHIVKYRDSLP